MTINTTPNEPAAAPLPSFMVYDDYGRVWPPGFKSQTCDPESPLCMLSVNERAKSRAASRLQEQRAASGTGWGNGDLGNMDKVRPISAATVKEPKAVYVKGLREFFFRPRVDLSIGEVAWRRLAAMPEGAELTCQQIAEATLTLPSTVRKRLTQAVAARVFAVAHRGSTLAYSLGDVTPKGMTR